MINKAGEQSGSGARGNRTTDAGIFSRMLCQVSYLGPHRNLARPGRFYGGTPQQCEQSELEQREYLEI
jgi:hypothetical protein